MTMATYKVDVESDTMDDYLRGNEGAEIFLCHYPL